MKQRNETEATTTLTPADSKNVFSSWCGGVCLSSSGETIAPPASACTSLPPKAWVVAFKLRLFIGHSTPLSTAMARVLMPTTKRLSNEISSSTKIQQT